MGLQGQINDVASDSITLYLVAFFAACISHLRSLLRLFSSRRIGNSLSHSDPYSLLGSGLDAVVFLSRQLSINRRLSYTYTAADAVAATGRAPASDCIFCLSRLSDGDLVRRLSCRHVFHKVCFDGWLNEMRFSCPLCRSSVVSDQLLACPAVP